VVLRGQPHILVIDDDEVARDSARVLLSRWGYRVTLADCGEKGLEVLKSDPPDLIVVDLQMPGISGLEVLEAVREFDPAIVCIMVTGFATLQSAMDAMKQGAYDFLPKPFSPDELKLAVNRGLERRFLERETQKLKEEKALMEANFVTMVSHQMRSPLAAVRQLLEVAATESLGPMDDKYKDLVTRANKRIDGLMQDINAWLNMVRIAEDGVAERKKPVKLSEIVKALAERTQLEADAAGQKLVVEGPAEEATLQVDLESLMEALYNITSNAVKYNREGGQVSIKAESSRLQADITISDQGPGIPEAELPFIFDDFFRSKKPELKAKPGTGLGLSIARRIVRAHEGEVSVSSQKDEGTSFTVSLPI
jgi:signal transduction histidine kinase